MKSLRLQGQYGRKRIQTIAETLTMPEKEYFELEILMETSLLADEEISVISFEVVDGVEVVHKAVPFSTEHKYPLPDTIVLDENKLKGYAPPVLEGYAPNTGTYDFYIGIIKPFLNEQNEIDYNVLEYRKMTLKVGKQVLNVPFTFPLNGNEYLKYTDPTAWEAEHGPIDPETLDPLLSAFNPIKDIARLVSTADALHDGLTALTEVSLGHYYPDEYPCFAMNTSYPAETKRYYYQGWDIADFSNNRDAQYTISLSAIFADGDSRLFSTISSSVGIQIVYEYNSGNPDLVLYATYSSTARSQVMRVSLLSISIDATECHRYTLTKDGYVFRLFIDGNFVQQATATASQLPTGARASLLSIGSHDLTSDGHLPNITNMHFTDLVVYNYDASYERDGLIYLNDWRTKNKQRSTFYNVKPPSIVEYVYMDKEIVEHVIQQSIYPLKVNNIINTNIKEDDGLLLFVNADYVSINAKHLLTPNISNITLETNLISWIRGLYMDHLEDGVTYPAKTFFPDFAYTQKNNLTKNWIAADRAYNVDTLAGVTLGSKTGDVRYIEPVSKSAGGVTIPDITNSAYRFAGIFYSGLTPTELIPNNKQIVLSYWFEVPSDKYVVLYGCKSKTNSHHNFWSIINNINILHQSKFSLPGYIPVALKDYVTGNIKLETTGTIHNLVILSDKGKLRYIFDGILHTPASNGNLYNMHQMKVRFDGFPPFGVPHYSTLNTNCFSLFAGASESETVQSKFKLLDFILLEDPGYVEYTKTKVQGDEIVLPSYTNPLSRKVIMVSAVPKVFERLLAQEQDIDFTYKPSSGETISIKGYWRYHDEPKNGKPLTDLSNLGDVWTLSANIEQVKDIIVTLETNSSTNGVNSREYRFNIIPSVEK